MTPERKAAWQRARATFERGDHEVLQELVRLYEESARVEAVIAELRRASDPIRAAAENL